MTTDDLVVLDACVLVSAALRDTLLRLAETPRLYVPKWSADILEETTRTLQNKFAKTDAQTAHLTEQIKAAFPESLVTGYKDLEISLTNETKDRHVLAAAIRCGAQVIVTFNLKHFPREALKLYAIEALHPDEFLVNQFHLDGALVTKKLAEQAAAINRTVEAQLRAFHATRSLPLFVQTLADALAISL